MVNRIIRWLILKQCCTCERVFRLTKQGNCPHCGSGNWVIGYIDSEDRRDTNDF